MLRRSPERSEARERVRWLRRNFLTWERGKITAILRRRGTTSPLPPSGA